MSKPSVKKPTIQLVLTSAEGFVEEFFGKIVEKDTRKIYDELVQILKNKVKE